MKSTYSQSFVFTGDANLLTLKEQGA